METVIEPDLDDALVPCCGRRKGLHLGQFAAGRLLDQHVPAGLDRAEGDDGELVVGRRDDHCIDVGRDRFPPVDEGACSCFLRELLGTSPVAIAHNNDVVPRRRGSALSPDQTASDDREPHHVLSHDSPRSAGTMRRSV